MIGGHEWTTERLDAVMRDPALCFTASSCGKCKKTANVVATNAGWFCACGGYNVLPWSGYVAPHYRPDLGPTADDIHASALRAGRCAS